MSSIVINEENIIYEEDLNMEIQYLMGEPSGQNLTTCSYLGDEMEHESVDSDSDLRLKVNEELSSNNIENNTFIIYLSAIQTEYRYKKDNIKCTGRPVLKCLKSRDETIPPSYFIGCDRWNFNEKFHRYISIKENVDLNLLQQLLSGLYEGKTDEPVNNCFLVLSNSSKKKLCSHPHCAGNTIKHGSIIQKSCVHSHPPPPPNRVPISIYKFQKEIHLQGHGFLGVIYNYSCNIDNFCEYVKCLEFFEDNHMMIICTTSEQLSKWIKCEHFQIDLSFKCVAGEINEFEVNYYNPQHNLNLDYAQAQGLGLVLNEIDKTRNWEEHLVHFFKSCKVHYKRGRKLDRERSNAIRVYQKYNIPTRRQDKGLIARNILSNKRQGDVNNSYTEDEIPISHKQSAKKKPRKSIVVNSDTENNDKENELTSRISELEYKEWVLALKEREIDLREREAKIYLMELSNFEKKRELEFVKS
ncbi:16126_t:CDS:10 [Funneliformis geosporum]|uniref:16126_t:CDS:1 n=1 Tax=Funneliformis geosporum TaxID=1117311 RepID=A0A9W4WXT3_9GLOM|nr:16126_t:CDS:10 [Funneliformis geosporum]